MRGQALVGRQRTARRKSGAQQARFEHGKQAAVGARRGRVDAAPEQAAEGLYPHARALAQVEQGERAFHRNTGFFHRGQVLEQLCAHEQWKGMVSGHAPIVA